MAKDERTVLREVLLILVGAVVGAAIGFLSGVGSDYLREERQLALRTKSAVVILRARVWNNVFLTMKTIGRLPPLPAPAPLGLTTWRGPQPSRIQAQMGFPDQSVTTDVELGILHPDVLRGLFLFDSVVRQAQRCREEFITSPKLTQVTRDTNKACLNQVVDIGRAVLQTIERLYPNTKLDVPQPG